MCGLCGLTGALVFCGWQWKCCGVIAYTDWHEALKEKVVPDRCCQEHYQNCGRNSTNMFWTRVSYRFHRLHSLVVTQKTTTVKDSKDSFITKINYIQSDAFSDIWFLWFQIIKPNII